MRSVFKDMQRSVGRGAQDGGFEHRDALPCPRKAVSLDDMTL